MIKDHVRWIVGSKRPEHTPGGITIPPDWIIYNAPRPIAGSMLWTGDCISGVFYAASPEDDFVSKNINIGLDAHMLRWATDEDVRKFVETVLKTEYPEYSDLPFEENRQYYEDKFWLYFNYGEI